jgi:hypothetical protein
MVPAEHFRLRYSPSAGWGGARLIKKKLFFLLVTWCPIFAFMRGFVR